MTSGARSPASPPVRLVWGCMLAAVVLMAALALVILPPPEMPLNPVLGVVLPALAVAEVATSFFIPTNMERRAVARLRLEVIEEADPNAEVLFRDQAPKRRRFADPAAAREGAMRVFVSTTVLRCALSISPAVLAVALRVTGGEVLMTAPLLLLAAGALAVHFPSDAKGIAPLERHFQAKLVERDAAARAA